MDDMSYAVKDVFGRSTRRLQMIAENLANVSTPGYRSGEVLAAPVNPFQHVLNSHVASDQERDATDLTQGSVRHTDRPLDFAIMGDGFFVVRADDKEYLTRNGAFEQTEDGTLVSAAGHALLDVNGGTIQIPRGVALQDVHVAEDGTLRDGEGRSFGQIGIENVRDEAELQRVGTTLFTAPVSRREPADKARVLGRTLESSNTVVFQELSSLMLLTRTVEALQRAQRSEAQVQSKMMDALSA